MLENKRDIIQLIQQEPHRKFLFFWGHHPSRDGSITKTCFSQWWAESPFYIDGITYKTAEHYMMAEKARLFGDLEMADRILQSNHPKEAKDLGRKAKGFDNALWEQHRSEIVIAGNYAKFSQNIALRKFLLETGDRILVEASPVDPIWGIGLAADHPDASQPEKWPGLNLLGLALMNVRDRIIQD